MKLIIVESPTKARTLSRFLGDGYQIEATMGHLRDLPEKKIGVEIKEKKGNYDFVPQYELVAKKKETIDKLKEEAKKADQVILATDPDREGEAIAWHVTKLLDGKKHYDRIAFHEITESAIKEALEHPRELDIQLVDAQQARRILDRLVGYKLSPLLWRKIRRGLSAGRVQSVAVRLIVEREREIEAFKPQEYWRIDAELIKLDNQLHFLATLVQKEEKKLEIKNKDEADKIVSELKNLEYKVKNVQESESRKYPYPPFTTSTLQQTASNLFGWSAKRTMQIAQGLYEEGLITYHRTDSVNLSDQAVDTARSFIKKGYGENYLPTEKRIYKTKSKVAQEAHEAIRVTKIEVKSESLEKGRDEKKLYDLIWKRFVACQMSEAVYDETKVDIGAGSYLLRTSGSKLKFDGWKKIYGEETGDNSGTNILPPLTVDELLKLIELLPTQHFTEAPDRFTEATLIKALEEKGIGRPSTYAPIISTIQDRQYVEKIERKFHPTVLGITVNDFLVKNFETVVDLGFTAKMEDDLDSIANGENKWVPVLSDFYGPFDKKLEEVGEKSKRVQVPVEQTDEICPECGANLVIRLGKFGKFLACSKFPDCKFTQKYVEKTGLKCPKCGGDVINKKTKKGKLFFGCSNYPNCDFASWKKEDILNPQKLT